MSSNAGFQLFPTPTTAMSPKRNGKSSTNPSRKPSTRRHAVQPQSPPQSAVEQTQSPVSPESQNGEHQYDMSGRFSPFPSGGQYRIETPQSQQQQYLQHMPAETSHSQTPTANVMQNTSKVYPQSQFRPHTPLAQIDTSTSSFPSPPRQATNEPTAIRSIFPTYNPNIRLEHQDYYPTVHIGDERMREIPRAVLSKNPYSPSISEQNVPSLPSMRSQLQRNPSLAGTNRVISPVQSPGQSRGGFGNGHSNASMMTSSPPLRQGPTSFYRPPGYGAGNNSPTMEAPSSTEELKELWKVTNGWRVSQSEGRTFVLQMTSDPEEPVHTLSSATDPFYTLRIEPTSTSAHLTMNRHDPSKAASNPSPTSKLKSGLGLSSKSSSITPNGTPSKAFNGSSSPNIKATSSKKGKGDDPIEVLTTTLEETHRRLPPNDGLVALLYPTAASALVINHQQNHPHMDDTIVRATAERECARLIWDEDSQHYYLSHPCLSQPFIIRITKSPAWSKVEYVLEHPSLPNDLAKLVRGVGGVGRSCLIIDTGTAGGLEAVYIVDVAICALCVVAVTEEKMNSSSTGMMGGPIERFEGPPGSSSPHFPFDEPPAGNFGSASTKSPRLSMFVKKAKKSNKRESSGMQDFEIDLESQESYSQGKVVENGGKKKKKKEKEEKEPFLVRVCLFGIRCVVWVISGLFGCALTILVGLGRCLVGKKK